MERINSDIKKEESPHWLDKTRNFYDQIKSLTKTQLRKRYKRDFAEQFDIMQEIFNKGQYKDETEFLKDLRELMHNTGIIDLNEDITYVPPGLK